MVKEFGWVSFTFKNSSLERIYMNISSKHSLPGMQQFHNFYYSVPELEDLERSGHIPQGCQGFLNSYPMPMEGTHTN